MTRVSVELSESAILDLERLIDWYTGQGVAEVGRRLAGEVLERIEALADHPDLGRVIPEFEQDWLRELIQPPFRIVYKRESERVRIVRVWRSERVLTLPGEVARDR